MAQEERLTYLVYANSAGTAVARYTSKADGAFVKTKLGDLRTPPVVELLKIEDEEERREAFASMVSEINKMVESDSSRVFSQKQNCVLSVVCSDAIREFYVRTQVSVKDAVEALTLEFGGARNCAAKLEVQDFRVHILSCEEEAFLEAQSVRFALERAGKKLSDFRGVMSTSSWTSHAVFFNGPDGDELLPLVVPLLWKDILECVSDKAKFFGPDVRIPASLDEQKELLVANADELRDRGAVREMLQERTSCILKANNNKPLTRRWVLTEDFAHSLGLLGLVPPSHLSGDYSAHATSVRSHLFDLKDWSPPEVYIVTEVREMFSRFFAKLQTLKLAEDCLGLEDGLKAWRVVTYVVLEFLAKNLFDPSAEWYFANSETTESGSTIKMELGVGYVINVFG